MTRAEIYASILVSGVGSMMMTLEAARQAAHTLRDEAQAGSDRKERLKYISKVLDSVGLDLRDVESDLSRLADGRG